MSHDEPFHTRMSLEELRSAATAVGSELSATGHTGPIPPAGGGSLQRGLPTELRERFIAVRAALFERGVFDPLLIRFDSASAPPASTGEIGARLSAVASSL